jgi:hypothetical protein
MGLRTLVSLGSVQMRGVKGPDWSPTHNQIIPVPDPTVTEGEYEWNFDTKEWEPICLTSPVTIGKTTPRSATE